MHQKLQGLQLFDHFHTTYLLVWLFIWILIPFLGKKYLNQNYRKCLVYGMLAFMVCQEILDYWNRTTIRELNLVQDLPLHFCHLALILAVILLIRPNLFIFEITYFWGLGAAFQAMLAPDMTDFDNHLSMFLFYAHHAMIILVCIWLTVVDKYRCRKWSVLRTMIVSNIIIWPVWLIDWLLDANYMYLMERPPTDNPLVFGEWPWYILNVEIVAVIIFSILNIPMFYLRRQESIG